MNTLNMSGMFEDKKLNNGYNLGLIEIKKIGKGKILLKLMLKVWKLAPKYRLTGELVIRF